MYSLYNKWDARANKIRVFLVLGVPFFVGGFLEILQAKIAIERSCEWTDLCMNTFGSFFAFSTLKYLNHKSVL